MKARQPSLFGERSLNPVAEMKRAMNLAAKECGLSRPELVDRLNGLIALEGLRTKGKGGLVTEAVLAKWLAPEDVSQVIPVKLLAAFCRAAGSLGPLAALAAPVDAWVIGKPDQVLLEMARAQVAEQDAARRKRRLAEQYKEIKK